MNLIKEDTIKSKGGKYFKVLDGENIKEFDSGDISIMPECDWIKKVTRIVGGDILKVKFIVKGRKLKAKILNQYDSIRCSPENVGIDINRGDFSVVSMKCLSISAHRFYIHGEGENFKNAKYKFESQKDLWKWMRNICPIIEDINKRDKV